MTGPPQISPDSAPKVHAPYETLGQALLGATAQATGLNHCKGEGDIRRLSYFELATRAQGLLGLFQSRGMGPGDTLVLFLADNEPLVDALWGALLGGLVAAPVPAGAAEENQRRLLHVCQVLGGTPGTPFLCTTRSAMARVANAPAALLERCIYLDELEEVPEPGEPHPARPDDLAFIQFSSGSTNAPKGVKLTHRNILTNIGAIITSSGVQSQDRYLSWMPLSHDMGLIGFHFTPVVLGAEHFIMAPELFVRRPNLWLQLASEHKLSILCSPNFGYRHFLKAYKPERAQGLSLEHVRLIFNGAEPISAALAREFCEKLSKHGLDPCSVFPVYGLAEAALAVTFPRPGSGIVEAWVARDHLGVGDTVSLRRAGEPGATSLVRLGEPLPGTEVRIAGADGAGADGTGADGTGADGDSLGSRELTVGQVLIRGANVSTGYVGGEDRVGGDQAWLDTGDLGFMHEGQLVITGRVKDLLMVNGLNYYPGDLETVVEEVDGVEPGRVAVCGVRGAHDVTEQLIVFLQHRGSVDSFAPLVRGVRVSLAKHTGLEVAHVLPIARIPKTTSGKIRRYALAEQFLSGEFEDVRFALEQWFEADGTSTQGTTQARLLEICLAHLKTKDIRVEDNLLEMGESSLTLAMVYESIDEHWPGKLDITDFFEYSTIATLAAYLDTKINEHSAA